jgi:type II secretory pathway pseudopilin PulG
MDSHSICIASTSQRSNGFTVVEILIVCGVFSILASLIAFMDVGSYRSDALHVEAANIALAMQTARTLALNNVDQCPHGVRLEARGYTVFEGSGFNDETCDRSRDQFIAVSYPILLSPDPTDVVFSQLSADSRDVTITIEDPQRPGVHRTVQVTSEGAISW